MHEFRWGFRAEQELDKENVLEVISQVLLIKDLNIKKFMTADQPTLLQMYECDKTAFKEQFDKVQAEKKGRGGGDASQEDDPTPGTSS